MSNGTSTCKGLAVQDGSEGGKGEKGKRRRICIDGSDKQPEEILDSCRMMEIGAR